MLSANVCNMSISRFGFLAIFISYVVLLLAEYLRPGFVATNGNVHWLWVVMAGWVVGDGVLGIGNRRKGVGRSVLPDGDQDGHLVSFSGRILSLLFLFVFGSILGLIVWHIGEAFGGMRLLFALAAAVTPFLLVRFSRIDS